MSFSVREATSQDIDKLVYFVIAAAIEGEEGQVSPDQAQKGIKTCLENPNLAQFWVLESNRFGVVGCVSVVKEWNVWEAGYYWWLQSIFITPEYRGQDLMEVMVDHVCEQARHEQALQLRLYIHKNNERGRKAYNREGFVDSSYEMMFRALWAA
jgi:GNAT superfamily N-acetyltransferase